MIKYPIRKFFGLTVLYIVIILGIFLLQFRSDTSISTTFGELRLQLTEVQNSDQEQLPEHLTLVLSNGQIVLG